MTVRETLEQVRSTQEFLSDSEEAAKIKIILPVLRALGWDTEGPDVDYEYPVGTTGDKPDIALLARGQPIAFVEAKRTGQNLGTPSQVDQIRRYFSSSEAKICALTNGIVWWLYLARGAEGDDEFKFAELRLLEDPLEELGQDLTMFLSRGNLTKRRGEAVTKQALRVLRARLGPGLQPAKLNGHWQRMLDEASDGRLDNDLVLLFRSSVYKRHSLRPTPEQIATLLREQGRTDGPTQPPPPAPTPSRPPSSPPSNPPPPAAAQPPQQEEDQEPSRKPTGLELWGTQVTVRSFNDIPAEVALILHGRHLHDFDRIQELRGIRWPFASRDKDELSTAKPVGTTGWYIDANLSAPNTVKRARRFLEHFGHNPDDLKLLYGAEDTGSPQSGATISEARRSEPDHGADLRRGGRTTSRARRHPAPGKPTGFELWGETYPVKRFNDISIGVAEALHDRHRHDFHRIAELRGKTRLYASQNPSNLFRPKPVGETGWHIDVNLSGPTHIDRAKLFLRHFGYDPDDLTILYD